MKTIKDIVAKTSLSLALLEQDWDVLAEYKDMTVEFSKSYKLERFKTPLDTQRILSIATSLNDAIVARTFIFKKKLQDNLYRIDILSVNTQEVYAIELSTANLKDYNRFACLSYGEDLSAQYKLSGTVLTETIPDYSLFFEELKTESMLTTVARKLQSA